MANVHLLGPVPYDQVPAFLQHADVVIIPHLVNPFTESLDPIKAYECLAAGRPTVATPVAGFRDLGARWWCCDRDEFVAITSAVLDAATPARHPDRRPRRAHVAPAGRCHGRRHGAGAGHGGVRHDGLPGPLRDRRSPPARTPVSWDLPPPAERECAVTFQQMLKTLWSRKLTIVVSVVVCVGAALAYSKVATPTYQSSALIQVNTPTQSSPRLRRRSPCPTRSRNSPARRS